MDRENVKTLIIYSKSNIDGKYVAKRVNLEFYNYLNGQIPMTINDSQITQIIDLFRQIGIILPETDDPSYEFRLQIQNDLEIIKYPFDQ